MVRAGLRRQRSGWAIAVEFVVEHLQQIMRDMFQADPWRYTPLVVTLALFIGVANLLGLVPGLHAPTADFSTTAALAALVFLAVPFYGIRACGAEMVPEITRTPIRKACSRPTIRARSSAS